jgi:hypothetical protein
MNNPFISQLPEQPTQMFGRNPHESGEFAMRERQRYANFNALKVVF